MAVTGGKEAGRQKMRGAPGQAGADRMTRFFAAKHRGSRESAERSRILRRVLPWATGILLVAILAWPFINQHSDSVTLSYKDLVSQSEKLRIIGAHYSGVDAKGRSFEVSAAEGLQERADSDFATLTKVEAHMTLPSGDSTTVTGGTGFYDRARDYLELGGGISLQSSSGYRLDTSRADVDLAKNLATGRQPVTGAAPFGSFAAHGFTLKMGERDLILEGGVKVRLDPGKRASDPEPLEAPETIETKPKG